MCVCVDGACFASAMRCSFCYKVDDDEKHGMEGGWGGGGVKDSWKRYIHILVVCIQPTERKDFGVFNPRRSI